MNNTIPLHSRLIISFITLLIFIELAGCNSNSPPNLKSLFNKNSITILITDSGLGGLSICADLEQNLLKEKCFEKVHIIFFNALPDLNRSYNEMQPEKAKISTFENALESMLTKFKPDLILIACNTLSVLYPKTKYYNKTNIPIIEIVSLGVTEITRKMNQIAASRVLICGTETTINSSIHKNLLVKNNIDTTRIFTIALKRLESEIQTNPYSETVKGLIELYLSEFLENYSSEDKLFVALCCTHYGYSENYFQETLSNLIKNFEIINPNIFMSNILSNPHCGKRYQTTSTTVQVFSQVLLSEEERQSIANAIINISPNTANALSNYIYDKTLFDF